MVGASKGRRSECAVPASDRLTYFGGFRSGNSRLYQGSAPGSGEEGPQMRSMAGREQVRDLKRIIESWRGRQDRRRLTVRHERKNAGSSGKRLPATVPRRPDNAPSQRDLKRWCRQRDSNPRPTVYKTAALPLSYAGAAGHCYAGGSVAGRCPEGRGPGSKNRGFPCCVRPEASSAEARFAAIELLPVTLRHGFDLRGCLPDCGFTPVGALPIAAVSLVVRKVVSVCIRLRDTV